MILKERFYVNSNASYLELRMVLGYYPDSNTFINDERIDDTLLRISAKGYFEISRLQAAVLPLVGHETFKNNKGNYQTSWYAQFEVRIFL